jgi:hypothetical protein
MMKYKRVYKPRIVIIIIHLGMKFIKSRFMSLVNQHPIMLVAGRARQI